MSLTAGKLRPMAKGKSGRLIGVVEAARRLGVTRAALYQAIKEGRLKAHVVSVTRKVWRINPADLASFEVSISHQQRAMRTKRRRQ